MASINNQLISILIKSTDNENGDAGATSLSEALKSNTTLVQLNLSGEYTRQHIKGIHQSSTLFHFHQINREQDWGRRSNITE